jgi:hypothetical protein
MKIKLHLFMLLIAIITFSFASTAQKPAATAIKNNIKIVSDGLKVTKAYLTDEEGNELKLNKSRVGKTIHLNLEVSGWMSNEGKVNLGASEKIITDKNLLVLYEDDLFPGKTDYEEADAKYINLKAVITSSSGDIKFFTVKFRVWDKNNGNNVTGSYTFSLVK